MQGDVTGIYNANGNIIAQYEYTPYGDLLAITDANGNDISTNASHIANINPIRYRGYYYDTETGFYYLITRYYDPEVGRFLNADTFVTTGQGILGNNMFAYCNNNPIVRVDFWGMCSTAAEIRKCLKGGNCCDHNHNTADYLRAYKDEQLIIGSAIDRDVPPDHPNFTPHKKDGGKKVKNPNGKGWGWKASDDGVWIHTPNMHGGEGWTIQYPDGSHSHAYPNGGVRNHFEAEQSTGKSLLMLLGGAALTVVLIFDDVTGIGAADDPLLAGSAACFMGGLNGVIGKKVCTVCGDVKYGY